MKPGANSDSRVNDWINVPYSPVSAYIVLPAGTDGL